MVNVFQVTRKIQDDVFLKPPQGALACLLLVFESWPFPKIPPKNLEARDENKIPMWEDAEVRKAGAFSAVDGCGKLIAFFSPFLGLHPGCC